MMYIKLIIAALEGFNCSLALHEGHGSDLGLELPLFDYMSCLIRNIRRVDACNYRFFSRLVGCLSLNEYSRLILSQRLDISRL